MSINSLQVSAPHQIEYKNAHLICAIRLSTLANSLTFHTILDDYYCNNNIKKNTYLPSLLYVRINEVTSFCTYIGLTQDNMGTMCMFDKVFASF